MVGTAKPSAAARGPRGRGGTVICHACHAEVPEGAAFCAACGARVKGAPAPRFCEECGAVLDADAAFCPSCGAAVGPAARDDAAPVDAAAATAPAATPEPSCPDPADAPAAGPRAATAPAPATVPAPAVPAPARAEGEEPAVDPFAYVEPAYPDIEPALDATRAVPAVPAADARPPERSAAPARRGRAVAIALGVAAVVALAAGGTWWYLDSQHRQQLAAEAEAERVASARHPVLIEASAPGWDTDEGASRLPVRITGTTAAGEEVDELQFADSGGEGIELVQGAYELTVEASPIAADGTVYEVPDQAVELSFTSDIATELIDATSQGGFALKAIAALDVTDDVVSRAYDAALLDEGESGADAAALKEAALARREEAVREREDQMAAEALEVEAAGYRLTLPAAWEGRVAVQVDGGVVRVLSDVCPRLEVCRIEVARGDAGGLGDVSAFTVSPSAPVGQGHYATVHVTNWGWEIAGYNLTGSTDPEDYFTMEEAREIVDLQTGGACTYDEILEARRAGGSHAGAQAIQRFLSAELVPSIEPL